MFCILHSSYLTYPFKNDVKWKAKIKGGKKTKKSRCCQGWNLWPSDLYSLCRACEAVKFCIHQNLFDYYLYLCYWSPAQCYLLVNWPVYKLCSNQVLLLSQILASTRAFHLLLCILHCLSFDSRLLPTFFSFFRLRAVILLFPCMGSYCGENSFSLWLQTIHILTEWQQIPCVYKYHGKRTQKTWQNGKRYMHFTVSEGKTY